jgi:hypothetical protein
MPENPHASIAEQFADLEDPRIDRRRLHPLINILVIALSAAICGADAWTEVELFGESKRAWFAKFLDLTNGIPSHDMFGRVFAALDAKQFQRCFSSWVRSTCTAPKGQVVALDGKPLRRSHNRTVGKDAIHMVSAWATENQLVLGQIKVQTMFWP